MSEDTMLDDVVAVNDVDAIDFVRLYGTYRQLDNGCRAAIARSRRLSDLITVPPGHPPALYILLRRAGIDCRPQNRRQLARVVWMLPFAVHSDNGHKKDLGLILRDVRRTIIDKMCKLTEDDEESLLQLRRALEIANHKNGGTLYVDWRDMGRRLFFWGDRIRDQIRMEYFMANMANC